MERGERGETKADPEPARPEPKLPERPKASVLASVHRREQALQQKQQEIAQREAEIAQREAIFKKGKYTPFEALKLIGYENPDEFLENISKTGGEWTAEQQKIHELETWKAQQEQAEQDRQRQSQEDAKAAQYKQVVDAWHNDIAKYVKGTPGHANSLLAIPGTEASVFQVIENHYRDTGERLDIADACEAVNQQMEGEFKQAIQTVAANPRGLELIQEYVASLAPQQPSQRGKSTARTTGINPTVRNQTRSDPLEEMDLDAAINFAAQQMNRASRG